MKRKKDSTHTEEDVTLEKAIIVEKDQELSFDKQKVSTNGIMNEKEKTEIEIDQKLDNSFGDKLDQIVDMVKELNSKMNELNNDFNVSIKYDSQKDIIIEKLHNELQNYKDDFVYKILKPIFNDLISLYDDYEQNLNHLQNNETESSSLKIIDILKYFRQYVLHILEKNGVYSFKGISNELDLKSQQILKVVKTDLAEKDKKIFESMKIGFKTANLVIRPEGVAVYRYQPTVENNST